MQQRLCIITGATSGIGLAAATALAGQGWRVALVGRDPKRGAAAAAAVAAASPGAVAGVHSFDLSRLAEVRRLADELLGAYPRIDVLVNNAGAFFQRRATTEDGLERTFALNHMAYFALTALLRVRLAAAAPARIVNVASRAHRGAQLDFDDLNLERDYSGWRAYGCSKLANILFTGALARRLAGSGVTANCLHPGFVASRFGDNNRGLFRAIFGFAKRVAAIAPEEGAKTVVHLAASPDVAEASGGYYVRSRPAQPSAAAQDAAAAERLWEISARLMGSARVNR